MSSGDRCIRACKKEVRTDIETSEGLSLKVSQLVNKQLSK